MTQHEALNQGMELDFPNIFRHTQSLVVVSHYNLIKHTKHINHIKHIKHIKRIKRIKHIKLLIVLNILNMMIFPLHVRIVDFISH